MSEQVTKSNRESNFELLRIVSMLMIVTLHLLSNEGILSLPIGDSNYNLGWILESFFIVAANVYVLISGYFSVKSKFSFKKVIKLWLTVLFYSYGITFLLYFFKSNFNLVYSLSHLKLVAFPVIFGEYWFVTIYMLLFLISPFLNVLVNNLEKKDYKRMLIILTIAMVLIKVILPTSFVFDKTGGYGIAWFIMLYLYAGYIRLHYDLKINKYIYLLTYILSSSIIACIKIFVGSMAIENENLNNFVGPLYDYNHILVLISSLCLFLFFKELKIKNNKFINLISSATFGVYLIHEQFFARNVIWHNLVKVYNVLDSKYILLYIIVSVLVVYTCCTIIELLRQACAKFINKKILKNKLN